MVRDLSLGLRSGLGSVAFDPTAYGLRPIAVPGRARDARGPTRVRHPVELVWDGLPAAANGANRARLSFRAGFGCRLAGGFRRLVAALSAPSGEGRGSLGAVASRPGHRRSPSFWNGWEAVYHNSNAHNSNAAFDHFVRGGSNSLQRCYHSACSRESPIEVAFG